MWRSVCCPLTFPKSCPRFLSTHLPGDLLFRDTVSKALVNSGRGLAQFSKFCLWCKNVFHRGSNVNWLPLRLHTWWRLWTLTYIDSWTNGFLLASSLLLVITEHTANGRHMHLIWQSQLESCIWCLRKPVAEFPNKQPFCTRQAFIYKADLGWMLYLLQWITLETLSCNITLYSVSHHFSGESAWTTYTESKKEDN